MADTKISALTNDASPTDDDLIVTVNDPGGTPGNKKVTLANFKTFIGYLKSNMAATAAPTATDDSASGYAAGSTWFRSDTGEMWRCRDATATAAKWVRVDNADFFGYSANMWYPTHIGTPANGTAFQAGTFYAAPFVVKARITVSALGSRVTTLFAGGAGHDKFALALYNHHTTNFCPSTEIAHINDLDTTTVNTVSGNLNVASQLDPGLYWLVASADNTTCAISNVAAGQGLNAMVMGGSAITDIISTGSAFTQGLSVAGQTYATWNDLSAASWARTTNRVPSGSFKVSAVP